MKNTRVRFTVRRMTFVVASVGLATYGTILWRKSAEYRDMAESYAALDVVAIDGVPQADVGRYNRSLAAYREEMAQKYDHAARYPWLPVAPDPVEPVMPEPE